MINVVRKMEQNGTALRHRLPSPAQFILEEFMQFLIKSINNLSIDISNIELDKFFSFSFYKINTSNNIKLYPVIRIFIFRSVSLKLHFSFHVQQRVKRHIVCLCQTYLKREKYK